ncbi:hypothetical protein G647_09961 [Cladophialophora carrionii CBS 160.54]|uniref:Uncharacterized protein n=1 Tax=Cladophialophora carrionii CBS 160.54 TaxID=1279043 RepID=V9DLQ0_9EURO|nr:uncharacterized protein G647_09961 [Cladophialophora carrionii CBS 160.54]ETI27278.1 hypothetical protein G647_09961 [Cladophialophora carrionii CBS 160.54]
MHQWAEDVLQSPPQPVVLEASPRMRVKISRSSLAVTTPLPPMRVMIRRLHPVPPRRRLLQIDRLKSFWNTDDALYFDDPVSGGIGSALDPSNPVVGAGTGPEYLNIDAVNPNTGVGLNTPTHAGAYFMDIAGQSPEQEQAHADTLWPIITPISATINNPATTQWQIAKAGPRRWTPNTDSCALETAPTQ